MWHKVHLGSIVQRGPGLSCIEATAVTPEGRITPEDCGIWNDSQMGPLKEVVEFAHSQNQNIMIQLSHAGRKASTVAPWISSGETATAEVNGWPQNCCSASSIPYNEKYPTPKEMTLEDIEDFKRAFVQAVRRAIAIGFDTIEIHAAHGYLLHQFYSPASNKRLDHYGGSFPNRVRLLLELIGLTREEMPNTMPLFVRVSATDWLDETGIQGWTLDETIRLAELLVDMGVDVLDVSSGGLHQSQKIKSGPGYQVPFARAVKNVVGNSMLVGTVGSISSGKQAENILRETGIDIITSGRMFLKNPGLVWAWADELEVEVQHANQVRWAFGRRGKDACDRPTVLNNYGNRT